MKEPPETITLAIESPPQPAIAPAIARGTKFSCPVGDRGRWSCFLPAAKLDLILRSTGMTPHYRWDVDVKPHVKTDLGAFRLRPGASFVAWLDRTVADRMSKQKPARARLLRPVAATASATTARLGVPIAEGTFDGRGWLQLAPLPAGSYILEVLAEGFAPARIAPIEIFDGKESSFRKLIELFPPIQVKIAIQPPSDAGEKPWRINWSRLSDFAPQSESTVVMSTDASGVADIGDQSPGLFQVRVEDAGRNPVWSSDVSVTGEQDAHIRIDLSLHSVKGNVLLGDEPLRSEVWFGGRDGAVRVHMKTDEKGSFGGRLPRFGRWIVEVTSTSPSIRTLSDVDVQPDKDLKIRVPDTSVAGWVASVTGERVRRASVVVGSGGRGLETKVDADGAFRLRGLAPGTLRISARDPASGDSSPSLVLQLQENQKVENVELRIEPSRAIEGTVTSNGRPVVGARISAWSPDAGGLLKETASDLAGNFGVALPARATRAHFTVAAPNRTLQVYELPIGDRPVLLDVAQMGGTVEISMNESKPFRLSRNGVSISLQSIFNWLSAHGQPLRDTSAFAVPNLAPGHYRLCDSAEAACVDGTLTPGGTLRLALPAAGVTR